MGAALATLAVTALLGSAGIAHAQEGFPAGSETVSSGAVSAVLSWQDGEFGPTDTTLTITRAGVREHDPGRGLQRLLPPVGHRRPRARRPRRRRDPEVVVTGSTGGEHCCVLMGVFDFRPAIGTYGQLVDVTRRHPALIRRNAAQARRRFRRLHRGDRDAGGFVSAYVADQYLLGHGSAGVRALDRQIARGILGRARTARAFRRRLLTILHAYGYR